MYDRLGTSLNSSSAALNRSDRLLTPLLTRKHGRSSAIAIVLVLLVLSLSYSALAPQTTDMTNIVLAAHSAPSRGVQASDTTATLNTKAMIVAPISPLPPPAPVHVPNGKTQLILITPTNRPHYLTRAMPHVFPLLKCFDVRWLIIHTYEFPPAEFTPIFRDVFPWITEITAYDPTSYKGGHERNVGRDYVVSNYQGEGIVYFLDDDNTLPDLCTVLDPTELHTNTMYFADQYRCGRMRLPTEGKDFSNVSMIMSQLSCKMDTGSFLIPLTLLRQSTKIMWGFRPGADAPYLGALIRIWVTQRGGEFVRRLPTLMFNYNHLNDKNDGCVRASWSREMLNESLAEYREVLERMAEHREEGGAFVGSSVVGASGHRGGASSGAVVAAAEVVPHDYAHVVSVLRKMLPSRLAYYLEIGGVGIGARSIFMSRQNLPTAVIGVDSFSQPGQLEEAEVMRKLLQGKGAIDWIQRDSSSAAPWVRQLLKTKYAQSKVDILYLNGNRSIKALLADFETYAPMVSGGGYIVFDEYNDTPYRNSTAHGGYFEETMHPVDASGSPSLAVAEDGNVRKAIMLLMRDRLITLDTYEIIGNVGNEGNAGTYPLAGGSEYTSADWPRSSAKTFILRRRPTSTPSRPRIVVLTGTSNPAHLTHTLQNMLPLHKCIDLHWVIVHGISDSRLVFTPLFREMFPWITELAQFGEESWPIDVGLEYIANTYTGDAFVYFLDDDNMLPDLCDQRSLELDTLDAQMMYYGDQRRCGRLRLNTARRLFNDTQTTVREVNGKMDIGNFLVPLSLIKVAPHVRWRFHRGPTFFAILINILLKRAGLGTWGGPMLVRRLPSLSFNFQQHNCKRVPWTTKHLNDSLREYRELLEKFTAVRDKVPTTERCVLYSEVVPHEYGYIMNVLRKTVAVRKVATYVEVGVGLGATSLFMSRFGQTNVIGVDGFKAEHQREEAELLRGVAGNGPVTWIEEDDRTVAVSKLQEVMSTNFSTKEIDILLLSSARKSVEDVLADFATYAPLVIDGGYVVFDEYVLSSDAASPTATSGIDVRRAVLELIRNGKVATTFEIVGNTANDVEAGPYPGVERAFGTLDWPRSMGKMFILWKGDGAARDPPKMREYERIMRSNEALKSRLTTLDLRRRDQPLKLKGFGRLFSRQIE